MKQRPILSLTTELPFSGPGQYMTLPVGCLGLKIFFSSFKTFLEKYLQYDPEGSPLLIILCEQYNPSAKIPSLNPSGLKKQNRKDLHRWCLPIANFPHDQSNTVCREIDSLWYLI